jgi:catechol 2,3-dioxygenase-like lactoylglutathione lyase family enzyme
MNQATINGIQQVGIGVKDANQAWAWYRNAFKMDVPIFQDSAEAKLMTKYTSGKVESRHAILALNMQGGAGFEIWQYTSKTPEASVKPLTWLDLGILAVKIRCHDIQKTHAHLKGIGAKMLGEPVKDPSGKLHFYVKDPYGNTFELIENHSWFRKNKDLTGGVAGVVIGSSSIDDALSIYQVHLQQSEILYDKTGVWDDFKQVGVNGAEFRRVLLQGSSQSTGAFGKLLCQSQVELIETKSQPRNKIFENRNWGDLGFIHVCFDVNGMGKIKENLLAQGLELTVDSGNEFDMGKAAGRFSYLEDPDGTLIEMVETFKVPIMEKIGWYLDLSKRKGTGNLPDFIVRLLSINRVKP